MSTVLARRFWKHFVVFGWLLIYVAINVFQVGGDAFVIRLNNTLVIPMALGATLLAFGLWQHFTVGEQSRVLWSGLAMGWALWSVAEAWWGIAALLGQEVPYPSWADFFWLAGYIPFYTVLWTRGRNLPISKNPWHLVVVWGGSLFSVAWTILFVLAPILQHNDPADLVVDTLNIIYPLADLLLLILVVRFLFAYQEGLFGQAWVWLSSGFVVHSLAGLLFSYASTANLYYPNGNVNLLSTLGIDIPYNLSYLLWLIGLAGFRTLPMSYPALEEVDTVLGQIPDTHLLIFTKGNDAIIDVSQNFSGIFLLKEPKGKTIGDALGLTLEDSERLLTRIKAEKVLQETAFRVATQFGFQQALISGILVSNPQGEYAGVTLLIRMSTRDYALDDLLSSYEKGIITALLERTGVREKENEEIKQFLCNYYQAYLKACYSFVSAEGGGLMVNGLFNELQAVARLHQWRVNISTTPFLVDTRAMSLAETRVALPALMEGARRYVIKISDDAAADTLLQTVRSHFEDSALTGVAHFEKLS